jgi:hypothetical protein
MTEKISGTKIHRDYSKAKSGAPFYVKKILIWTVFILTVLTLVFFVPAIIRRRRGFKTR